MKKTIDIRTVNLNEVDDKTILLILSDSIVDIKVKIYIFKKYIDRICKLNNEKLKLLLLNIDTDLILSCYDEIYKILNILSLEEIESLVYLDDVYYKISKTIKSLLKCESFKKNKKYSNIKLINDLEENKYKEVSSERINKWINKIINELTSTDHSSNLTINIYKNLLYIINNNDITYLDILRKKGYQVINTQIEKKKDITLNMLIFDIFMNLKNLTYLDYINIEVVNNSSLEYINYHDFIIYINQNALNNLNNNKKKNELIYLFFNISEALEYLFSDYYILPVNRLKNNLHLSLKIYNMRIAKVLREYKDEYYYLENKNNFFDNYIVTIEALDSLYEKYNYLKVFNDDDKISFNCFITQRLSMAYESTSPYTFTTTNFKKIKIKELDKYKKDLLEQKRLLSTPLELIQNSLNEKEKLLLGYPNIYVNILIKLANGDLKSTNIFIDIPKMYKKLEKKKQKEILKVK